MRPASCAISSPGLQAVGTASRALQATRGKPCRHPLVLSMASRSSSAWSSTAGRQAGATAAAAPLRAPSNLRRRSVRASAQDTDAIVPEALPSDPLEMVAQAAASVKRAMEDGKTRQRVDLLLPINEKEFDFGATEAMDYPCNIMKEYDTAINLTKLIIQDVLGASVPLKVKRLDAGGVEGEPCGAVFDAEKRVAAVVYPTSDMLKTLRTLAEAEGCTVLMVNPQWRESGQLVSDFGIGPWKKRAYDFLDTFEQSYSLIEKRIGSPGSVNVATGARFLTGGVLRYLRCYPGKYEVFAMAVDGSNQLLGLFDSFPDYKESEDIIQKGRDAKLEIFARATQVSKIQDEGMSPAAAGLPSAEMEAVDPTATLLPSVVDAMDAVQVKRALSARDIPTSGKLADLRKRLKEAACP